LGAALKISSILGQASAAIEEKANCAISQQKGKVVNNHSTNTRKTSGNNAHLNNIKKKIYNNIQKNSSFMGRLDNIPHS